MNRCLRVESLENVIIMMMIILLYKMIKMEAKAQSKLCGQSSSKNRIVFKHFYVYLVYSEWFSIYFFMYSFLTLKMNLEIQKWSLWPPGG